MSIILKKFLLWDNVYAQSYEWIADAINNIMCDSNTSDSLIKKQYKDFYSWCIKKNNKETFMCFVDYKKKEWFQECSQISDELLTKEFCSDKKNYTWNKVEWKCVCPNWVTIDKEGKTTTECLINWTDNLWIQCDAQQLINGTCSWNINKTLGIRSSDTTPNPTLFLQDMVLAATSFVWTVIMIALVVMGIKYVQWWYDEGANWDLKGNIKKLLIWLFLVIWSYTIIRLIQYIARGY